MSTCVSTKKNCDVQSSTESKTQLSPYTDSYKTQEGFVIKVDLPGVSKENLDIQLDSSLLKIEAYRNLPKVEGDSKLLYSEIVEGKYLRSFKLPDTVDVERIQAKFENGVLELVLPEKAETQPKKIKVELT